MQTSIQEFRQILIDFLIAKGFSNSEAHTVAEPYIIAELMGKKTHGISKFLLLDKPIAAREGKPEIVKDKFNYALINAHKELGQLSADFACDILIEKASQFDNATVAVVNSYYYTMAGLYAEKIARAGFIALIYNNGGPATVAPYGGIDPLFGTNPIAIGIPTNGEPIILDMATSERPWGEVNLAKVEERLLPDNIFINQAGDYTTNPNEVEAIAPFGNNPKGYGINLMTEILTGALVNAKMGLDSQTPYDLGFLFTAYSPSMFSTQTVFTTAVERLKKQIKESRTQKGVHEITLPGEKSYHTYQQRGLTGMIDVPDTAWSKLKAFVAGADIQAAHNMIT